MISDTLPKKLIRLMSTFGGNIRRGKQREAIIRGMGGSSFLSPWHKLKPIRDSLASVGWDAGFWTVVITQNIKMDRNSFIFHLPFVETCSPSLSPPRRSEHKLFYACLACWGLQSHKTAQKNNTQHTICTLFWLRHCCLKCIYFCLS